VATATGARDVAVREYGRLGAWVVGHALAVEGPIHETYLVGSRDTEVPARGRTEIGWPIFRITLA
jgi:hypothetical protein